MATNENNNQAHDEVMSNNTIISAGAAILVLMGVFAAATSPEVMNQVREQSVSATGSFLGSAEKHARASLVPAANR